MISTASFLTAEYEREGEREGERERERERAHTRGQLMLELCFTGKCLKLGNKLF
jgi:hypothetical protein